MLGRAVVRRLGFQQLKSAPQSPAWLRLSSSSTRPTSQLKRVTVLDQLSKRAISQVANDDISTTSQATDDFSPEEFKRQSLESPKDHASPSIPPITDAAPVSSGAVDGRLETQTDRPFKCNGCRMRFPDQFLLDKHKKKFRQLGIPGVKCEHIGILRKVDPQYKIGEIESLTPSSDTVTSASGYETLATWTLEDFSSVSIPANLPVWTPPNLPFKAQPSLQAVWQEIPEGDRRVYLLEVILKAVRDLKPTFRFDNIDVLATSRSMTGLLRFCVGAIRDPIRASIKMINNTLVVGSWDMRKSRPEFAAISGFEEFVRPAPDPKQLRYHMRLISYKIGSISCAVSSAVHVAYDLRGEKGVALLRKRGYSSATGYKPEAAMIRAWTKRIDKFFHLVVDDKTRECHEIEEIDQRAAVAAWEAQPEIQDALRRFADLLTQLQKLMKERAADGRRCMLILDPGTKYKKQLVSVFPVAVDPYQPLSDLEKRSWSEWSEEALRSG